jgi:hypothetical protein
VPGRGLEPLLPLVPGRLLLLEEPLSLLPGDSAPPVAVPLLPDMPKYEKMLWRQAGWLRSVLASNVGADCNLLASPLKTKLNCWPAELGVEDALLPAPAIEDGRRRLQGTAICLPVLEDVVLEAPGKVAEDLGPELLSERIAKSTRPEAGLMMTSLIVPASLPELLVIWAPVS